MLISSRIKKMSLFGITDFALADSTRSTLLLSGTLALLVFTFAPIKRFCEQESGFISNNLAVIASLLQK
jgi:hypothetical protein